MLKHLTQALCATALLIGTSMTMLAADTSPTPGANAKPLSPGQAEVLKWPDGKKAAFMLQYDDSCLTHLTNAIPELEKRDMVGTFYIVPGGGTFTANKAKWEEAARSKAVVLGNHTFTHKGVKALPELEPELVQANEAIKSLRPDLPWPRLIAFARPGGVPWEITKEETAAELAKHHLVSRPQFSGPPLSQKTLEACLAEVDTALAKGEMRHLDFHGIGGDWHVTPMDWYVGILDKLHEHRADFWITDPVSLHKYGKERESAKVNVVENSADMLVLELKSDADAAFYDQPLTLRVGVPAQWKQCTATGKHGPFQATVVDGAVTFSAVPGGGPIRITGN